MKYVLTIYDLFLIGLFFSFWMGLIWGRLIAFEEFEYKNKKQRED